MRSTAPMARLEREEPPMKPLLSLAALTLLIASFALSEFSPARLLAGLPAAYAYILGTLPTLHPSTLPTDLAAWLWGWRRWLLLLWDTLLIAFLGTLFGTSAGFLLSFLAARNLTPSPWLGFAVRRALEVARTVPDLVFAMLFVVAFGLGPLAGVLALSLHATGVLGKVCGELLEHAKPGPLDGMRSTGADWLQTMRFGAAPQILPGFLSQALFRFEYNVRSASVIGFVGVGGIGQELYVAIRQFVYTDISAILLVIALTVAIIDQASERLRLRLSL
jgi:phosphonate transport system permease protein